MADTANSTESEDEGSALFSPSEILPGDQLEGSAAPVRNMLEQRRQAYKKAIAGVVSVRPFLRAQRKWKVFEAQYNEFARNLDESIKAHNRDAALVMLHSMERTLLSFERDVADDVLSGPWGFATQQAADYAANKLRDELTSRFAEQIQQVRTAAEQLLAIKTAGEASSSFDAHVKRLAGSSKASAQAWLTALVGAWTAGLVAEGTVLVVFNEHYPSMAYAAGFIVAAAVVFLLYFVHGQHKVAKMMAVKYEHMEGLAGGGAVNLIGMLGDQEEFRKRVLERLADSFMSLDDVTGTLSRTRTPAEDAIRGLKEATKTLVAARKANE
jgi:hypothetical protein